MNEGTKESLIILAGVAIMTGTGYITGRAHQYSLDNKIPDTAKVQSGYVIPNKLEMELEDLDRNGENEVLLKYEGKPYLFKLNDKGEPQVVPYTITPRE